jgi:hypothetical protein
MGYDPGIIKGVRTVTFNTNVDVQYPEAIIARGKLIPAGGAAKIKGKLIPAVGALQIGGKTFPAVGKSKMSGKLNLAGGAPEIAENSKLAVKRGKETLFSGEKDSRSNVKMLSTGQKKYLLQLRGDLQRRGSASDIDSSIISSTDYLQDTWSEEEDYLVDSVSLIGIPAAAH